MLQVFERQVLQLAFQSVQPELVGKRGVEVGRFFRYPFAGFLPVCVFDLPHDVHAVGNHDEDDAHVFGERKQQAPEILASHAGGLFIKFLDAVQAADDAGHVFAEFFFHVFRSAVAATDACVHHHADDGSAGQPDFRGHDECGLHVVEDGVHAEHIPLDEVAAGGFDKVCFQLFAVVGAEDIVGKFEKLFVELRQSCFFRCGKKRIWFHCR